VTLIVLLGRSAAWETSGLGCNQPDSRSEVTRVDAAFGVDSDAEPCFGEGHVVQAHRQEPTRSNGTVWERYDLIARTLHAARTPNSPAQGARQEPTSNKSV
jgi:hypothetical protein